MGPLGVGLLGMGLDEFEELDSDEAIVGRFTYDLFEEESKWELSSRMGILKVTSTTIWLGST